MNFKSIVAFISAGVILCYGIATAGPIETFLNEHAILMVLGGTAAAGSIAFQVDRIFVLFKIFFRRVIRGRKENYVFLIEELMRLAEAYRSNSPNLEKMIADTHDHFLKEAMTALMDDVIPHEDLARVLRSRVRSMHHRQADEVLKFKTLGKYPPAFGLMGTTLSMIALLQKLGQPGGQKLIGPSMSLGLVATFYGVAVANLIFNPIAENLADSAKENKLKNMIIVEGVRLIMKNTNPVLLAEELNSFLNPSERVDWKKVGNGAPAKKAA
jgi:chemotaxis protein MotA